MCSMAPLGTLGLLWYVNVFCHLQLCYSCELDDWNWTVCLAAGQLSWTISVVTGLWSLLSPVFTMKTLSSWGAAVFLELYPLWSISCSPFLRANCSKNCSCSVPGVASCEKPEASQIYWLFFPFSSSCLLCPFLVAVRAPHWWFFFVFFSWGERKVLSSAVWLCVSIHKSLVFDATSGDWFQPSAEVNQYIFKSLHWLPLDCFFYPHFTMETNTVSP